MSAEIPGFLLDYLAQRDAARAQGAADQFATLTDREREVLGLVGDGHANAEIAERLHVGITTVKTHVANLLAKTGSANRVRLAVLATRNGLTTG